MLINQAPLADPGRSGMCSREWRELYRTALFETDRAKAADLIVDAERVIANRIRSLFHNQGCASERQALDAALYALHVLKQFARPTFSD